MSIRIFPPHLKFPSAQLGIYLSAEDRTDDDATTVSLLVVDKKRKVIC